MDLSVSSEAQRESFEEKLEWSGWDITFKGRAFKAIVALGQVSRLDQSVPQLIGRSTAGRLTQDVRLKSTIEFLTDAMDDPPKEGDEFTDARGIFHRVKEVFRAEFTYECRCHMSNPV